MMGEEASDLSALVAGIRSHKGQEDEYICARLKEIRRELQSGSRADKSTAVLKLWYLRMLGCDVPWISFGAIEVMSAPLMLKRPGFGACAAAFSDDTPVAILTVNLFKKELLQSTDSHSVCLALTCMASMATPDIARDLYHDVHVLLSSSKPAIRKRAVLCLFRLFLKYPPAVLECLPKIRDLLEDNDPSVVACTLSTILELAIRNPKPYVKMAPMLYKLFIAQSSNWITEKALRLLMVLCPLEPRLPPKLLEPLTAIFAAGVCSKSVEIAAIRLVLHSYPSSLEIVKTAAQHLYTSYLKSTDTNLRCLSLTCLADAIESSADLVKLLPGTLDDDILSKILAFLSSPDPMMRRDALRIMKHSVTVTNFPSAVGTLTRIGLHEDGGPEFTQALLDLGAMNHFGLVEDLQAYVCTVVQIARYQPNVAQATIREQLIVLAEDVPSLRPFLLRAVSLLLWPCTIKRIMQEYLPPPPIDDISVTSVPSGNTTPVHQIPRNITPGLELSSTNEQPAVDSVDELTNDGGLSAAKQPRLDVLLESPLEGRPLFLVPDSDSPDEVVPDRETTEQNIIPSYHHRQQTMAQEEYLDKDLLLSIIMLLGRFRTDVISPLQDSEDRNQLQQLIDKCFELKEHKSLFLTDLINVLTSPESPGQFASIITVYVLQLAEVKTAQTDMRLTCLMTGLKLVESITGVFPTVLPSLIKALMSVKQSWASELNPQLRVAANLITILLSNDVRDIIQKMTQLLITHTLDVPARVVDLKTPFIPSLIILDNAGRPQSSTNQQKRSSHSRLSDLVEPLKDTSKHNKKHDIQQHTDDNIQTRSLVAAKAIWKGLYDDDHIAVYSSISGRLPADHSTEVVLAMHFRCRSIKGEHIKNVVIRQVEHNQATVLAADMKNRSKKVHFEARTSRDSLLFGETGELQFEVKYTVTDASGRSSVVCKTVPLKIPLYLLLRPHPFDETSVQALVKMQPAAVESKFSVIRHPCRKFNRSSVMADIETHLTVAAGLANLHISPRRIKQETITVIMGGKIWSPEDELLDGLRTNLFRDQPGGIKMSVDIGVTVVVGVVSVKIVEMAAIANLSTHNANEVDPIDIDNISNTEDVSIEITVVFRSNNSLLSQRSSEDIADLIEDLMDMQ